MKTIYEKAKKVKRSNFQIFKEFIETKGNLIDPIKMISVNRTSMGVMDIDSGEWVADKSGNEYEIYK